MTFEALLSLLSQIATWITVLLVLFTFFEMVKQRKSAYKPDIVVNRSMVYAYMNQSSLPSIWVDRNVESDELAVAAMPHRVYCLRAHNLGLGAAKEVDFQWSINIEKMTKAIEDQQQSDGESIKVSLDENGLLTLEFGTTGGMVINTKNDLRHSVNFILPFSVDSSGH